MVQEKQKESRRKVVEKETTKQIAKKVVVENEQEVLELIITLKNKARNLTKTAQAFMMWLGDPENKYNIEEREQVLANLEHNRKYAQKCLDEALNLENQLRKAYGKPLLNSNVYKGIKNPYGGVKNMQKIKTGGEQETIERLNQK